MLIRYQLDPDFGTNFQFVTERFVKSILYNEEEDCIVPISGRPTSGTSAEHTEGFDLFIQVIDLTNFSFNVDGTKFSIEGGHIIGGDPDDYHFNTDWKIVKPRNQIVMLKYIRQGTLTLDQLTSKQLFEILTYNDEDELTIFSDVGSESSLVVSNHMIGYLFRDNKLIAEFTFTDDGEVQGIFPYTNIHEVLSLTIELMDPNGMSAINGQVLYWEKGEFVDKITN